MKKLIALLLVAVMLTGTVFAAEDVLLIAPAPDAAAPADITLHVIAPEGTLLHTTVPMTEGANALSVLQTALKNAAARGVDVRIVTPHIPDKRVVF